MNFVAIKCHTPRMSIFVFVALHTSMIAVWSGILLAWHFGGFVFVSTYLCICICMSVFVFVAFLIIVIAVYYNGVAYCWPGTLVEDMAV